MTVHRPSQPLPVALTIGSFDGVHCGHAALLAAARQEVDGGGRGRVIALVFDPHPLTALRPEAAPPRLTTFDQRRRLLLAQGADEVVRLEPSEQTLAQSPEAFVEWLASTFRPAAIVEGKDFRFGRQRAGDVRVLAELGQRHGVRVRVLDPIEVVLDDHSLAPASSTLCRWLLKNGRVADAARVLGRTHVVEGEVVRGDRRGRTIGFPTANIATEVLTPADGVYAAWAELPDGSRRPAAVNVGARPTFAGAARTLEAHLISIEASEQTVAWAPLPGLPEYGWPIRLHFSAFLRDSVAFAGIQALMGQLRRDCARALELLGRPSPRVLARDARAEHEQAMA